MRLAVIPLALCPLVLALGLPASPALGHPGGTDAQGCHTNRKTGEYHCHTPKKHQTAKPTRPSSGSLLSGGPLSGGSTYYANCSEARAAGAAPLRRGDSGYRAGLDRDNDGIACE